MIICGCEDIGPAKWLSTVVRFSGQNGELNNFTAADIHEISNRFPDSCLNQLLIMLYARSRLSVIVEIFSPPNGCPVRSMFWGKTARSISLPTATTTTSHIAFLIAEINSYQNCYIRVHDTLWLGSYSVRRFI